jgi:uncharacterized NAD-dependent epimerase/dehydratase family protein
MRRIIILAEGAFGDLPSKTAMGVIRYGPAPVVAVIDSQRAGRNVSEWLGPGVDIPVVADLEEAIAAAGTDPPPSELLLGTAPPGGRIPPAWRATLVSAIERGLDVVSGLHELISEDPELTSLASRHGVTLVDHRRAPERQHVASGRRHRAGSRVVLTVGTDCAIGKMTVALELRRAALAAGLSATFVPTGQTGIMIEGWGVSVDRVIADFVNGTAEWLVEQAEEMADWVFVEGQGAIDHPGYSAVTAGLLHGAAPHAMVLVHEPGRLHHHGWEGREWRLTAAQHPGEHPPVRDGGSRGGALVGRRGGPQHGPARRGRRASGDRAGGAGDRPARRRPIPLRGGRTAGRPACRAGVPALSDAPGPRTAAPRRQRGTRPRTARGATTGRSKGPQRVSIAARPRPHGVCGQRRGQVRGRAPSGPRTGRRIIPCVARGARPQGGGRGLVHGPADSRGQSPMRSREYRVSGRIVLIDGRSMASSCARRRWERVSTERLGHAWPSHGVDRAVYQGATEALGRAGGPPPTEPMSAPNGGADPDPQAEALAFVRFCYRRRAVAWPELYDEMCAVAARCEYRGLGYEQLEGLGIRFVLAALPHLAETAARVIAEERNRPAALGLA